MKFKNKNFNLNDGIVDFNVKDPITMKVKHFYEQFPFPNYKTNDNKQSILEEGNKNTFVQRRIFLYICFVLISEGEPNQAAGQREVALPP